MIISRAEQIRLHVYWRNKGLVCSFEGEREGKERILREGERKEIQGREKERRGRKEREGIQR